MQGRKGDAVLVSLLDSIIVMVNRMELYVHNDDDGVCSRQISARDLREDHTNSRPVKSIRHDGLNRSTSKHTGRLYTPDSRQMS